MGRASNSPSDVSAANSEIISNANDLLRSLQMYGKLNRALIHFVQNGTKGEMVQSKADLVAVLGELDSHLDRYSKGGTALLAGATWNLLDCLIAPLVHRSSAVLSNFEGSPLPGSALNDYMTKVCSDERWIGAEATGDAAEASAAYVESLRLGLGKNVRPKKRRQSANICI